MRQRQIAVALIASTAAVAGAIMAFGPSPATGAASDHDVWRGQPVKSWAEGQRVTHADAPATLVLQTVSNHQDYIDVGVPDFSPGDYVMLRLRLLDEAGDTHVGRGTVKCEFAIGTQACDGTLLLYNRGQIALSGVFYENKEKVALSILGGTGDYKGVGGLIRVVDVADGQSYLTLHFTR
jgi:hypothetical protein